MCAIVDLEYFKAKLAEINALPPIPAGNHASYGWKIWRV